MMALGFKLSLQSPCFLSWSTCLPARASPISVRPNLSSSSSVKILLSFWDCRDSLSFCLCSPYHSLDWAWSVCSLHGAISHIPLDPRVPRPWEEPRKVQWSLWAAEPRNSPALWGDIPRVRAAETLLHSVPSKTSLPSVLSSIQKAPLLLKRLLSDPNS